MVRHGAIADYDKAIELNPKFSAAYNNRGLAKNHKSDYDSAISDCSKAIELDPKYAKAYHNRGWAKTEKGDYDGAIADYDKFFELDSKPASAYGSRALVKELKGDFDGALADLARWDESASILEQHDYAQLWMWTIRARRGNTAEATKELSAYLEKRRDGSPTDWPSQIGKFLLGKTSESDFLAAAAVPDPKKNRDQHCEAWYYAAVKRLLVGDKELAADYFTKCLATEAYGKGEFLRARSQLKTLGVAQHDKQ